MHKMNLAAPRAKDPSPTIYRLIHCHTCCKLLEAPGQTYCDLTCYWDDLDYREGN